MTVSNLICLILFWSAQGPKRSLGDLGEGAVKAPMGTRSRKNWIEGGLWHADGLAAWPISVGEVRLHAEMAYIWPSCIKQDEK